MKNDKNRGFALAWILGIMGGVSLLLFCSLESIAAHMKINRLNEAMITHDEIRSITKTLFWDHYNTQGNEGYTNPQNTQVLTQKLKWALPEGVKITQLELSPVSPALFDLNARVYHKKCGNPAHPLHAPTRGRVLSQELTLEYLANTFERPKTIRLEAKLKEVPFTEVGFICPVVFSPKNLEIPIKVNGIAMTAGFADSSEGEEFVCEKLVTKFLKRKLPSNLKVKQNIHADHKFAFSFGLDPFNYLLNTGNHPHYLKQSYFHRNNVKKFYFDGENVTPTHPAMEVREFNSGPKRLIVDMERFSEVYEHLYVFCTNETALQQGLVARAPNNRSSQTIAVTLITNGHIWAHGGSSNIPHITLGSTSGHWTFTDKAWKENELTNQPLNMTWCGNILTPTDKTLFSSPQSANKDGTLTLHGASLLLGGYLGGNLKQVIVNDHHSNSCFVDSSIRFVIPKKITSL